MNAQIYQMKILFSRKLKIQNNPGITLIFFLNWDSLHPRLNSHYEAWSYKEKKHKKITAYRKSV